MGLNNSQRADIYALGEKIELPKAFIDEYIEKHPHEMFNHMRLNLCNIRANQLGLSYGNFVVRKGI